MIALLAAAGMGTILALIGTPFFIRWLRLRDIGQEIREDGPRTHRVKHGTPTMGGIVILGAALCGYLFSHLPLFSAGRAITVNGILVLFAGVCMGLLGFLDDYLKYRNQRSLGLNKKSKTIGQIVIALVFAILVQRYTGGSTQISFVRPIGPALPVWLFAIWVLLLFVATSNAVNLTDGLDGLAAGSSNLVFGAFVLIAFWQFRHPAYYGLAQSLDLAVVAAAFAGACAGFLWWNANPARIFMGDTGALGLGGAIAALAFLTNTQLLLLVLGGIFVLETLSVIAQVFAFRVFGRRVLRMAPIHHHFEIVGWPETTVIVRFWIIAGFCVTFGVGLFYADWLSSGAAL
ncbi:MAG: phospho-N-acetylmuramoyl-pentapeptide-transferase [Acidimicrobiia bacterium]|nr:phospho-N-acetylmuramoyl-pentapeptide-transferase [Acidimicrobiia bacterium]